MTKYEIIQMAISVVPELDKVEAQGGGDTLWLTYQELERFAALVAAKASEKEREAIMDEWWMCVQSDLENGVKSLNERAAEKWKKEYTSIAGFAATIEARGNSETK